MPSLVEFGPVVLEKKMKLWKVYDDDDDNNDELLSEKLTWAYGSGELIKGIFWGKHSLFVNFIQTYTYKEDNYSMFFFNLLT